MNISNFLQWIAIELHEWPDGSFREDRPPRTYEEQSAIVQRLMDKYRDKGGYVYLFTDGINF